MSENELETMYCILETVDELSPRQRQVLQLVCEGYTQAETAEMLGIAQRTVSEYLKVARKKIKSVVRTL